MAKVLIYAEDGVNIQDQCQGSSWTGGCRSSLPGAPVVCAGRKIVLDTAGGIAGFTLLVEPDARSCPLAALNLVGKDVPTAALSGGTSGVLRRVCHRAERAAAGLAGWGRVVRAVLPMGGLTN